MMLAELTTVKTRIGLEAFDVGDDAVLTNFIEAVSERLQRECNRLFERNASATYEFNPECWYIHPDRYPIEAVSAWELKSTEAEGWVAQTAPSYRIGRRQNVIELDGGFGVSAQVGRITYAGGYVLPGGSVGAGQTGLPADVEWACVEQTTYLWQNRDRLGLVSMSNEGGTISQFAQLDLLPQVRPVVRKYERWLS